MKKRFCVLLASGVFVMTFSVTAQAASKLIITGVIDGPITGGLPKAVELYVLNDIADLGIYGLGFCNNGGGTDGEEFAFSGAASAGDFLYVSYELPGFTEFFGFAPDEISTAVNINGDDPIELFMNNVAVDAFGDIALDGSGEPWEYLDGWAYRENGFVADTTFTLAEWAFSGKNALDGETTNPFGLNHFPAGSYLPLIATPVPPSLLLLGVGLAGLVGLRKRSRDESVMGIKH